MKRIDCPDLGRRNITEFAWGGEVQAPVDSNDTVAWSAALWQRSNVAGPIPEWWYHIPTGTWFIIQRNTLTDEQIGAAVPA